MTKDEEEYIRKAVDKIRDYGIRGLDDGYLIATDIDGDLWIAPVGILDKILWEAGGVNANSFVKIKDLI